MLRRISFNLLHSTPKSKHTLPLFPCVSFCLPIHTQQKRFFWRKKEPTPTNKDQHIKKEFTDEFKWDLSKYFGKNTDPAVIEDMLMEEVKILSQKALEHIQDNPKINEIFGVFELGEIDFESFQTHYDQTRLEVLIKSIDKPDVSGSLLILGRNVGTEPKDVELLELKVVYENQIVLHEVFKDPNEDF